MTQETVFDQGMTKWHAWQAAPWGRLRYRQADENLSHHITIGSKRILDLGGGDAVEAIAYAQRGHDVTVADYSTEMLSAATARAAEAGVELTTIAGDIRDLSVPPGSFDVVLCHNLVQFFADPADVLPHVIAPLRAGGVLSLISANRAAEVTRLAWGYEDPAAALDALDNRVTASKLFDADICLWTPVEMIAHLDRHGASIVDWYGIRAVCDLIPNDEIKHDPDFYDALERLELTIAGRDPYRQMARFYHLIATV